MWFCPESDPSDKYRQSDLILADALRHVRSIFAEADNHIAASVGNERIELGKEVNQIGGLSLHQLEESVNVDHADVIIASENASQEAVEGILALHGVLARIHKTNLRLQAEGVALIVVHKEHVALSFLHGSIRHIQNTLGLAGTLLAKDDLDHGQSLPFMFILAGYIIAQIHTSD